MSRRLLLGAVALVLLEACTASGPRKSALTDTDLLSGATLPWAASTATAVVDQEEAFGLDDDMRAFVAPLLHVRDPIVRLNRLREAMIERGLFSMAYADLATQTVSETFRAGKANCLSFTMLFVALARGAGLEARFQLVDVPPTFTQELGLVIVGTHVNAAIEAPFGRKFVIDFDPANVGERYAERRISDRYALALFYNNLAAEALLEERYESSFAFLRAAARANSDIAGVWVNVGVLYSRNGLYDYAEAAYLRALEADPGEQSALANLVSAYSALGETALAAEYEQRIRRYRESNPYYHLALGKIAYEQKRYDDALTAARKAIRLKNDDDDFFRLEGLALTELGEAKKAAQSFARAEELAVPAAPVELR